MQTYQGIIAATTAIRQYSNAQTIKNLRTTPATTLEEQQMNEAITQKMTIGWDNFHKGKTSVKWMEAQHTHAATKKRNKTVKVKTCNTHTSRHVSYEGATPYQQLVIVELITTISTQLIYH